MKSPIALFLAMTVSTLLFTGSARADEVHLKNGDRLTGHVVRMEGGKLLLETTYAGKISISWLEVAGMVTKAPVKVVLEDDTRLEGVVKAEPGERMKLDTQQIETPVSFRLAQVKMINPAPEKIVTITARANVNITSERGNTDTDNFYLSGEFAARTKQNRYTIGGEFNKEKSDDVTTSKNWLVIGNYSHFLGKKWYLFVNTLFEHDEFQDLKLRSTVGAGGGYQIFESPQVNLSLSAGLAEVDENFYVADDNDYSAGQWSLKYDQFFFKKFVQLFHDSTGYIRIDNADDWFVKTRTGVRFPIYKGLTATLQYNYDWNNHPSADAQSKEDAKILFLLGYEFQN
jgi:putative salt-induced outer membrane protein YdiY